MVYKKEMYVCTCPAGHAATTKPRIIKRLPACLPLSRAEHMPIIIRSLSFSRSTLSLSIATPPLFLVILFSDFDAFNYDSFRGRASEHPWQGPPQGLFQVQDRGDQDA